MTLRVPLFAVIATGLLGCTPMIPRYPAGTTLGAIEVGSPRLETRERLINDRRDREAWLVKERETLRKTSQGFSGVSAVTSSSYLGAQANLKLDPSYRWSRAAQSRSAQSALEDDRAIAGFRTAERDEVIARRQRGEITLAQAKDDLAALGYSVAPTPAAAASAPEPPGAATAPGSTFLDNANAGRLAAPAGPADRTQLSATPVEDFMNKLAAEEVATNEINATRGDDGHDIGGNTLYRLTFDTTVLPQSDTSAWAVVRITASFNNEKAETDKILSAAKSEYVRELLGSNEALYRSMLNNIKRVCWQQELAVHPELPLLWHPQRGAPAPVGSAGDFDEATAFRRAFLCASEYIGSNTRRALERRLSAWSPSVRAHPGVNPTLAAQIQSRRENTQDLLLERPRLREPLLAFQARRKTLQVWAGWLAQIFDEHIKGEFAENPINAYVRLDFEPSVPGVFPYAARERYLVDDCSKRPNGCADISPDAFFQQLKQHMQASVYAVTPKESVQQISETSATRRATEFLLGLSAVAGDVGLSGALQSIKSDTAQFEAIRRQPLVVGFTDRGHKPSCTSPADRTECQAKDLSFGWVLGPSFSLARDGKVAGFRHSISQKSVAVTLSVPAWLTGMTLSVQRYWLSEDGERRSANTEGQPGAGATNTSYNIKLPATHAQAFAGLGQAFEREPRVDSYQYLDVTEGMPATVMVTGRDLWRSTEVFLGAQRADVVNNLPNYGGVTARFEKIESAGGRKDDQRRLLLSLYTSEGSVVAGVAQVHAKDEEKKETKPLAVSGSSSRFVAGVAQSATLSVPLAATDSAVVRITRPEVAGYNLMLDETTTVSDDRKNFGFTLPATLGTLLASGTRVTAALVIDHGRAGVEVVGIKDPAIFYAKADDAKVSQAKAGKLDASITVALALPSMSTIAFSELKGGSATLIGKLTLDGKDTVYALAGTCKIDKDACTVTLTGDGAWKAAVVKAKTASIKLAFDGKDVPEFAADTLALKK